MVNVAMNVPCKNNSTASIQVLLGQAPNFTAAELEKSTRIVNTWRDVSVLF